MNPRGAAVLEPTYAHGEVDHPEHLRLDGRTLTRIDDPLVAKITHGDPTMGWEGDLRFALYAGPGQWVLVRLEHDNVYRRTATTTLGAVGHGAVDIVGQLVAFLVSHDTRRGFDPAAHVQAHNDRRDAALDAEHDDFVADEIAPKLRWAVKRDLGAHF